MKIILVFFIICLCGLIKLNAQPASINIQVEKKFPRYEYRYGELEIDIKEVALVLKKNEQAYDLIKSAKRNSAVGNSLMYIGAAMIIIPLGEVIKAGSFKYYGAFAGIGAGMIGISLPFLIKANKKAERAVELYNSGLSGNIYNNDKPQIYFGSTGTGIGLSVRLQ